MRHAPEDTEADAAAIEDARAWVAASGVRRAPDDPGSDDERSAMKTVITRIKVQQGQETAWDDAFRSRVEAAKKQEGFVAAHVCVPVEAPDERLVIGTWETETAWRAWHDDDAFRATRRRLEQIDEESGTPRWHDVLLDEHR